MRSPRRAFRLGRAQSVAAPDLDDIECFHDRIVETASAAGGCRRTVMETWSSMGAYGQDAFPSTVSSASRIFFLARPRLPSRFSSFSSSTISSGALATNFSIAKLGVDPS